jgi:hypothetical protein
MEKRGKRIWKTIQWGEAIMLTKNGLAVLKTRIEKELTDMQEAVRRIGKKLLAFSQ